MLEQNAKIKELKNPHDPVKVKDGQILEKNKNFFLMRDSRSDDPKKMEINILIDKKTRFSFLTLDKKERLIRDEKISWRDLKEKDGVSVIIRNKAKKKNTYFADTVQKITIES